MIQRALAIADAVAVAINDAANLPPGVTARRVLLPQLRQEELVTAQVLVLPRSSSGEPSDRSALRSEVGIDVAVIGQAPGDAESLALLAIADAVARLLSNQSIDGAAFIAIRADPLWDMTHLHELSQLTALIHLTYLDVA